MPLTFLPNRDEFFAWSETTDPQAPALVAQLLQTGAPALAEVIAPGRRGHIEGRALPLLPTLSRLAQITLAELPTLPGSFASWALASQLALDLACRERIVPTIVRIDGRVQARWRAALAGAEDIERIAAIARSMSPATHAVRAPGATARKVWAADALLRAFLDAATDALVRDAARAPDPTATRKPVTARRHGETERWEHRWCAALEGRESQFATEGFAERTLLDDLDGWSRPALGLRDRLRGCFRLELPEKDQDNFTLRFLLQAPDDPSLIVTAAEVWRSNARTLRALGQAFRDPQESLLEALGRAARLFPPLTPCLSQPRPESLALDATAAWSFLNEGAAALGEAGFNVIVPAELTAAGRRRLRLKMRISHAAKTAGTVSGAGGFGLQSMLAFDWQAAIGDQTISARELAALTRHKAPLVLHRGQWMAIDPHEIGEIRKYLASGGGTINAADGLIAALAGETRRDGMRDGLPVAVTASGDFARLIDRLRHPDDGTSGKRTNQRQSRRVPATLRGSLRPYQERGFNWLATMGTLGLGACLADDMGLGKTVQLLAFLLYRLEAAPDDLRPALLVAPTSVIGNWQREIERFAPTLRTVAHYGPDRARRAPGLQRGAGTVVLTSYGLLRRDVKLLSRIHWSTVALDEAQNIKNSASATAKAARALDAGHRFALTGTPVENRLAELWSILEFANPGLLGSLEAFRREYAVPIERYGNDAAADRLRRIVAPFVLRREKRDPKVIRDLPPKHEMTVTCTLTREQVSLYRAVVDAEMRRIEEAEGIERRGRVLALLTFLKQICNHPAHYLNESGPLPGRSGKLERIAGMLEEAIAAGDRALLFTQYTEMGERLVQYLSQRLGVEVAWLHGGTRRKVRDELVRRFQEDAAGPGVFVLSLKAGGTGLNLTAASHVFHYDRWWNPAVEDQATDRAYRIGQKRSVQVHKLVCAGTVEEKVDALLTQKRKLAARVVGGGENWITELGNQELRDLISLSADAGGIDDDDDDDDEDDAAIPSAAVRTARRKVTPRNAKR